MGLAAAERELGVDSTTVVFRRSPYAYSVDEVIWDDGDLGRTQELKRWRFVARALRDFDVIHFNFGSTIAPQRPSTAGDGSPRNRLYRTYHALFEQFDLRLFRRAGKAIFVTFQGDDARQGGVAARLGSIAPAEASPGHYTPESDANKRRRIARFDRFADGIYALNPDLLHALPARARFVPYAHVDTREWDPPRSAGTTARPLVLHAPTDRKIKGTRFVLDAVSRLQEEGLEFDFQLVEGLTQAEAKELYHRADVVVDQLLVGWYGGFAVEVMALERPVVAYLRDEDLVYLPPGMREEIPVISAGPDTIYDRLKELLTTRRSELAEIGRRGRAYVSRWHDPLRIAQGIIADYEAAVGGGRQQSKS